MYVKKQTEPGLFTVGFYEPGTNKWVPESDHNDPVKAAERVHFLNGGTAPAAAAVSDFITIEGGTPNQIVLYTHDGDKVYLPSMRNATDVLRRIRDTLATWPGFKRTQ